MRRKRASSTALVAVEPHDPAEIEVRAEDFSPTDQAMAVALFEVTGGAGVMTKIMKSLAAEVGYTGDLPSRLQSMLWKAQGIVPYPQQRAFAALLLRAQYTDTAFDNFEVASKVFQENLLKTPPEKQRLWNLTGAVIGTQPSVHDLVIQTAGRPTGGRKNALKFSGGAKSSKERWTKAKELTEASDT